MKQTPSFFIALFAVAWLNCSGGGQNVPLDDTASVADTFVEGDVPVDTGPDFGNDPAFKVLDTGEQEMWTTMYGVDNPDGGYLVFVAGGFGAVMWYNSEENSWHHINVAQVVELAGIWAASDEYIVVCGEDGFLKRYYDFSGQGPQWYNDDLSTGVEKNLTGVHASAEDNIWVVGEEGTILHWDGFGWSHKSPMQVGLTKVPYPDFYAVHVAGPGEAYFAGDGVLVSWDGSEYTADESTFAGRKLKALASSGDGLWIAADKGVVFKQTALGLEEHKPNVYSQFEALWISPSGKVHAVGTPPALTVWIYDGNVSDNWESLIVESPPGVRDLYPDRITPQSRISSLWGTNDHNFFLCTKEKQVLRYAVH